jgi:hypothetical protein
MDRRQNDLRTALAERIVPEKLRPLGSEVWLPQLADVVVGIYLNKMSSHVAKSFAARFADMFA